MSIRLIAIDIDGTLMPTSGPAISDRNCSALRDASAAGVHIVIATGRRHAYALPLIHPLGLPGESLMISSNGAITRRLNGEQIDKRSLPSVTSRVLCRELRSYGTLLFTFDREGFGALVIENAAALQGRLARWVEANRPYLREVEPLERAFDDDESAIQGMVCGGVEQMRAAEMLLRERGLHRTISMHRTEYPLRDLSMLDLLPPGCSKGTALHRLAVHLGIDRTEIMAIGDNLNDLEMLEYAGHPVVMGNAGPEMLTRAETQGWRRAATNDEDGVALIVEGLLAGDACPGDAP